MENLAVLTGEDTYFEDFEVGQTIRHARGKTITNLENVNITNMVMNTADGHFNADRMSKGKFSKIVSYGGVNLSVILGLSAQDTIENAVAETGLDKIRLKSLVFHGDTLYAYSRVLEKREHDQQDVGVVVFKHWGVNQDDVIILELERTALIKRRSHWGQK
jgi:itaconyl-CoA hydratase